MSLLVEKTASGREYKVKDMTQADFGRLEISGRDHAFFALSLPVAAAGHSRWKGEGLRGVVVYGGLLIGDFGEVATRSP
ncbi:hypothetical protein Leryth_019962 [Lithospermum erythrorhizon]|nr:hypothetical protein Leryth_019962 [Lithospermum erythrorhizon]